MSETSDTDRKVKLSRWTWFKIRYAMAVSDDLESLEEAARTLREEGYTTTIEPMNDGVYCLTGERFPEEE